VIPVIGITAVVRPRPEASTTDPENGDDVLSRDYTIERDDGKEAELVTTQWLIHAQPD
jgi:hypothetical protein